MAHLQPFARLQPAHVGPAARRVQGPLQHPALRHRGHGGSEAPKGAYTLDMLAEDLRQLLAELKIRRTHYCGLSMGGMIGQVVALTDPGVFDRVVLADTGHARPPKPASSGKSASRPRRPAACSRWWNRRSSAGSPRISGQAGRGHHPQADRLDAGTRLRRLLPRYLEPEYHRAPEGDRQPGARDHRRAGRGGAGNALHRRERAGGEAGGDSAGGAHRQHRAGRRLQSRSRGVPFIPRQRASLRECTPKRSSTRATLCATSSSSDFGLA